MSPALRHPAPVLTARPNRRWHGPVLATALVLLVHAALLLQTGEPGPGSGPTATAVMRVRQVAPPPDGRTAVAAASRGPAAPHATRPPRRAGIGEPGASPSLSATLLPPAPTPAVPLAVAAEAEPAAAGSSSEAPVYATRTPATTTMRYTLQRGAQQGHAELQWQVDDEGRYSLSLHSEIGGNGSSNPAGPGSASVGRLDANGLAPDRHTESRRGRELRAVNFQRDTARVTFSSAPREVPLQAGAQDRLSWLLQLAAIAEANPALRAEGQTIQVFVIGTRGDAETWTFTVLGREDLALPVGTTPNTLHLHREPQRLYDTHADIWLDPARQHLPVRVRLHLRPTGEGSEWQLEGQSGP